MVYSLQKFCMLNLVVALQLLLLLTHEKEYVKSATLTRSDSIPAIAPECASPETRILGKDNLILPNSNVVFHPNQPNQLLFKCPVCWTFWRETFSGNDSKVILRSGSADYNPYKNNQSVLDLRNLQPIDSGLYYCRGPNSGEVTVNKVRVSFSDTTSIPDVVTLVVTPVTPSHRVIQPVLRERTDSTIPNYALLATGVFLIIAVPSVLCIWTNGCQQQRVVRC